jgi:hypothetical protein
MNQAALLPIDAQTLYEYFNAKKDGQKKRIDDAIDTYRNTLIDCLLDKIAFQEADLYQLSLDDLANKCGQVMIFGTGKKEKFVA